MNKFVIESNYKPSGDQPAAIEKLTENLQAGKKFQTLLGVTGSGKTFTIANVIEKVQRPTLVIAHNKTLAAQLASEFRQFFPKSAVEYFVSYYDYYQPEAYLPSTDTFIEKDMAINEEIDRLRHAATAALLSRKDVIIVASVSCIYGLGSPEFYEQEILRINEGDQIDRRAFVKRLVEMQYARSDVLARSKFRAHGETFEIMRPDREIVIRVQMEAGSVKRIVEYDQMTGEVLADNLPQAVLFPAKHFVVPEPLLESAMQDIRKELEDRVAFFQQQGKILEMERIRRRTQHDLEMMEELGYCSGIENYSLYLSGRQPGQAPYTLIDYFPDDFLMVIDESHVTLPQLHAMYGGDLSRKKNLVEFGFRLPSAFDNRPLKFEEFEQKINQLIFVSATPGEYEIQKSKVHQVEKPARRSGGSVKSKVESDIQNDIIADNNLEPKTYNLKPIEGIVEQIVRPTGLIDPEIELRPIEGQVKDVIDEIKKVVARNERVLITTLTKKMAEDLATFLKEAAIPAEYLHSEVDTLDRIKILEDLRRAKFDVLVGVNLLREGLDLPEVSLVAILDADKEGFLRSETSLIQTIGRAARNVRGRVILYADNITGSMERAIRETERRRTLQIAYNKEYGITPKTIEKNIKSFIDFELNPSEELDENFINLEKMEDLRGYIKQKEKEMKEAAKRLEFEKAALIRDEIGKLRKLQLRR